MGFYGVLPDARIRVSDFKSALRLTFIMMSKGTAGGEELGFKFRLIGPNGATVMTIDTTAKAPVTAGDDSTLQLIVSAQSVILPGPGEYQVEVEVAGHEHYKGSFKAVQVKETPKPAAAAVPTVQS
jgi:hypothetical protein